jgi:N-acetylmuramoyl-L-alanine amidase
MPDGMRLFTISMFLCVYWSPKPKKLKVGDYCTGALAETELQTLAGDRLPAQQQVVAALETRLTAAQDQWQEIQTAHDNGQQALQRFLESSGHFLPDRERLTAITTTLAQLDQESERLHTSLTSLAQLVANFPNPILEAQIDQAQTYVDRLNQDRQWLQIQRDSFQLASPNSPERLAIAALLKDLRSYQDQVPDSLPLNRYLDFLEQVEDYSTNLLTGFDDLAPRLAQAQTEATEGQSALEALQEAYRALGLEKSAIAAGSFLPDLVAQTQATSTEQQAILQGYETQIADAYGVAEQLEQQRQQHQAAADHWQGQIHQWEVVGHQKSGKNTVPVYDWVYHPEAEAQRDLELAAAATAAQQRDEATQQAQALEASLLPAIATTQATIASLTEKATVLHQAAQSPDPVPQQLLTNETAIGEALAAIAQTEVTIATLKDQINTAEATLSHKQDEIGQREQTIATTETEIAHTQAQIAVTQAEIDRQQTILNHQAQATALIAQAEEYEQLARNLAGEGSLRSVFLFITYSQQATQLRQQAQNHLQQAAALEAPGDVVSQDQIDHLQQTKQALVVQQEVLQTQVEQHQQALQDLHQDRADLNQQVTHFQAQVGTQTEVLAQQEAELHQLEQTRRILQEAQAHQQQLLVAMDQRLQDKYQAIQLTERFLQEVDGEIDRLHSRLDLLNQADRLQEEFEAQQNVWEATIQNQQQAVQALQALRAQGEADRQRYRILQEQLVQRHTQLASQEARKAQLEPQVQQLEQALEVTALQLETQRIKRDELLDNDAPLQSAEAHFLAQAEIYRQQLWFRKNGVWTYNSDAAENYRHALQNASLMADERNQLWPDLEATHQRIGELDTQHQDQAASLAPLHQELQTVEAAIVPIQQEVDHLQTEIAPIIARLAPLAQQEAGHHQTFVAASNITRTLAGDLAQTLGDQIQSLRRMVSFGVLASEADIDFFVGEVEPQVQTLLTQLEDRNADFDHQTTQLSTLVGEWQADLAVTTDDTSRLALEALISQTQGQLDQLARLKTTNSAAIADLTADLDRANQGLRSLRLSQELQVRQELSSNDRRLQSLEAQLQTEDAAETAVSQDSVVAYAQLADQVAQGLKTTAEFWTEDLLTGHGQTRELGQQQQQLSAAVDQLLAEIETQFADPHGDYQARETQLDQAITTHGVIAPRTDALEESVLATAQTIAQLEQSLGHDAALSAILAPVLARYNLEAQEVAAFEQQYQTLKQEDETLAHQYEHQRQQYQANADYWKDRIQQWEVVGSRKSGKKRVPVYGWVHHPEAEANYKAEQAKADAAAQQRDAALGLPTAKAYRQEFLTTAAANGTAIGALQAESQDKQQHYQPRYEEAKAKAAENTAVAVAALEAAHNYEQLAAQHLARSRRLGPDKQRATWTESRRVKYRGRSGKTKRKTVTITHVNHDWIAWNTYTKQAKDLRAEAATLLNEVDQYQFEIERWEPLTTQWTDTTQAANQAEPSIREARNLVDQLEAAQALIPDQQAKLGDEQALLPLLQDQLVVARQELAQSQDSIAQAWHDYDQAAVTYGQGVATVLSQRAGVERQAHTVQQELEAAEQWVEHQSVALADETIATTALLAQLQTRLDQVTGQVALGPDPELEAKQAQLDRAVKLLANKATVLTNQQAALTQKRALLTAQHEVILAEQRLLDAYLESPSADTSALQDQLKAARAALAEAQRLAEQAAASSAVLTAPLQDLQQELLSRNDAELTAAREKQDILDDLLAATQLNANYTLEAALKQQELNDLELQVLQRLQEATRAGSDEAAALWDVARNSSIAAAAEIYHKDYRDLASDRGGSCSGGLARPEDQQLADRYYGEWLNYQELTRRAQAQADSFAAVREAAEAELGILQTRQTDAAERLQTLNDLIVTTDEEITAKQEALAIAEAQLAEISRLRDQTEQTFLQLLTLEELNLAQAQLEVALAEDLKSDIDAAVAARQERELAELQRERVSAQVRLEQLRQIQSEDDLRQALNDVRRDVGLADVGEIVDRDALNAELALLLAGLREIRAENADLPPGLDTLMQETEADLLLALKGEEAEEINAKLLEVAEGLIDQVQQYKAAIADLEREEQEDEALLQQAEQDLQGATLKLFLQIQNGETLDAERELLTPLNLEVLQTVALADQAVEISEELANHSRDLLQQIIGRRKEERKQRNRAFWNETLGTLAMVLNLIGTILNFIPIPILKPIALAFKLAAGIIQGIISGINGDWVKAIYQITKSALNFLTNDLNVAGLNPDTLKLVKQLSEAADAAYGAYEAHKSGDNVLAVLRVFEGIADVAKIGTNNWKNADFAKTLLISLGQNAEEIYQVVQNAEEKDWIKTVEGLYGVITSIGGNFSDWRKAVNTEAGNIADSVLDANANQNQSGQEDRGLFDRLQDTIERAEGYIDDIEKHIKDKVGLDFDDFKNIYKTVDTIVDAHEDGGIDAWLGGIDEILGIWREDIQGVIDNSVFEEHVVELAEKHKTRPENLKVNPDGKIYKADFRGNLTYLGELNSDEKQVFFGDQNQAPISGSEGVNQTGNDNVGLGQLQTLTGRRILLDPGHGLTNRGNDPGAIGNGTDEATENLHQARLIADRLRQQGATVIILDEALSLAQIGQRAEGYDLFVSLHQNAFNGQAQGHEVYYHPSAPAENAQLAQSINNELDEVFPDAIIPDRGTKTANFSVLRNAPSDVPSVLVESLFIDAPGMSRANIERASEAVARGIENFLVP